MSIYELAMQDPQFRKLILIQFGMGEHNPIKVEKWLKKYFTYKVNEWRKLRISQKIVPMVVEGMSEEQRNRLLGLEEAYIKLQKGE